MKNILCIVGRPNVGKSSLFNKIVGRRVAITEDTPGVTRDRLYAEAKWLDKKFTVVDTGGIEPESEEEISKNIKLQAEIAQETADVILFVVDGINGLSHDDKQIASELRKSDKPVILVVNKIDKQEDLINAYEFYELGLGDPFCISAEHSLGIGDLLDKVFEFFPKNLPEEEDEDLIKIAIIGKPNAGKSSLLNNILGEERTIVSNVPGTTRDAIDTYTSIDDRKYLFIDTAGLRRKRSINALVERYSVVRTLGAIDRADVSILMVDANDSITEQDTKICGYALEQGKAIVIAINKWDLIDKTSTTMANYEKDVRSKLPFLPFAPIVFISAKTGKRVDELIAKSKKVFENSRHRITTGTLNDIINHAVLQNQPPSDKGKRPKIFYASQVGVAPPTFVIFCKNSDIIHFSYTRYLENQIRDHYPFEGNPMRISYKERNDF